MLRRRAFRPDDGGPAARHRSILERQQLISLELGDRLRKIESLVRSSAFCPVQRSHDDRLGATEHCLQFVPVLQIQIENVAGCYREVLQLIVEAVQRRQSPFEILARSNGPAFSHIRSWMLFCRAAGPKPLSLCCRSSENPHRAR